MKCVQEHRWVEITWYTIEAIDREGNEDEESYENVTVECLTCGEKLGERTNGEWSKSTRKWVRDLVSTHHREIGETEGGG